MRFRREKIQAQSWLAQESRVYGGHDEPFMCKMLLGLACETLGVAEDATEDEIQAAFRARSLESHPDKNPNDPEAGKKFNDIMEARATLMKYDAEYQEERRQQEQQAKRSRTQQATDYTAVPGSASAAVGWQVAWQVSYPDGKAWTIGGITTSKT